MQLVCPITTIQKIRAALSVQLVRNIGPHKSVTTVACDHVLEQARKRGPCDAGHRECLAQPEGKRDIARHGRKVQPVGSAVAVGDGGTIGLEPAHREVFVGKVIHVVGRHRRPCDVDCGRQKRGQGAGRAVIRSHRPGARRHLAPKPLDPEKPYDIGRNARVDGGGHRYPDDCAGGRGQQHLKIVDAFRDELEIEDDMVDLDSAGQREGGGKAAPRAVRQHSIGKVVQRGLHQHLVGAGLGRAEEVPDLGHPHGVVGIDHAITVVGVQVVSAAVPGAGAVGLPQAVFHAGLRGGVEGAAGQPGRGGKDVLHVAPA